MKYILTLLLILCFGIANATNYYIAPTGLNGNAGTIGSPWKDWERISQPRYSNILVGGDTVFIRGGTYTSSHHTNGDDVVACYWQNINGLPNRWIVIMAYPGESPVLDCSNVLPFSLNPWIIYMGGTGTNEGCSYVKVKGLHIKNLAQVASACGSGGISRGFQCEGNHDIIFEQIEVDHIGGAGYATNYSTDIVYTNCDAHHLADALSCGSAGAYGGADGWNRTNTGGTRCTYNFCRAWLCSDDGWDALKSDGIITYNGCWAFWNGYYEVIPNNHGSWILAGDGDGIKAAPPMTTNIQSIKTRFINNCLTFENAQNGIDQNGLSPDPSPGVEGQSTKFQLYNNTSYKNVGVGYQFPYFNTFPGIQQDFKNNIAFANGIIGLRYCAGGVNNTHNSWLTESPACEWTGNLPIVNAWFQSVNSGILTPGSGTGMDAPRQADGSLPVNSFLKLVAGTALVNTGIDVGLPYCGSLPDLGAYELCSQSMPVANAGVNQTITLPVNSCTLSGTATTSGSIVTWFWRNLSGGAAVIGTQAQTTTITGLVQGTYNVELTVTDNAGQQDTDTMTITVNAAPLIAPTCAGTASISITLPINQAALVMTATSNSGLGISSYGWVKTSGGAGSITNPTSASATATGLVQGSYVFTGTATDGNTLTCTTVKTITVNAALVIPTANAGIDQTITLPVSSINLSGSGSGGTINSYRWTVVQGIGGTLGTPNAQTSTLTGLVAGTYKVELRVGNTVGQFGYDTMQVLVKPVIVLPTATCAPNITITLPTNSCNLVGVGTGTQTPLSYLWTKITLGGVLVTPTLTQTQFTTLPAASYAVEYKVTDNDGNIAKDTIIVTVNAAPIVPTANAGADKNITLPTATVTFNGSGSGGTINGYQWTVIGGLPGTSFSAATSATTNFTVTSAGTYTVQLRVSNTAGNFGYDTVLVTVNPVIVLPVANAGVDGTINLPTNTVVLNGSLSTGTSLTYSWTKLASSPTGGNITSSTSITTQANNLIAGVYSYQLQVTDINAATSKDTVVFTVVAQPLPPVVTITPVGNIYLPQTTATLTGNVILATGTVTSYSWVQTAGSSTTITTSTLISTDITGLTVGSFTYTLTVTTTDLFVVTASITINVYNLAPSNGIKYLQGSIQSNNVDGGIAWTFYPAQHPTTLYMIGQMLVGNVYKDFGARVIPSKNPAIIDYYTLFNLRGMPRGRYYFRVAQVDAGITFISEVVSVKKK